MRRISEFGVLLLLSLLVCALAERQAVLGGREGCDPSLTAERDPLSHEPLTLHDCVEANEPTRDDPSSGTAGVTGREPAWHVAGGGGDLVESFFFPGEKLPRDVEASLQELLSQEVVQWIEAQEREGHATEGGVFKGQYISPDMKHVIRSYVQKRLGGAIPEIEASIGHRERGTDVGTSCSHEQKRRSLDQSCGTKLGASMSWLTTARWLRSAAEGMLRKEVLLWSGGVLLLILLMSALLFVYGFSDLWNGVLVQWQSLKQPFHRKRRHSVLGDGTQEKGTNKHAIRTPTRLKGKEIGACHGRMMGGKKRTKAQFKARHEAGETKREPKPTGTKATLQKVCADVDGSAEWQEVMYSRPKGRGQRAKLEEEKTSPQTKRTSPVSSPTTPKTTEPHQTTEPAKDEAERKETGHIETAPTASEETDVLNASTAGLHSTIMCSGAFADDALTNLEFCPLPDERLPQVQVQPSPFAASTDLPFSSSYTTHPTEEQFQSKIDCLLRNLRNKPFSRHTVTQSPLHQGRRTATESAESPLFQRSQLWSSYSGSLDPALSWSGALNNRVCPPYPYGWNDDVQGNSIGTGRFVDRMQQRAGSMPLSQSRAPAFTVPHRQASGPGTLKNGNFLSNDCSLFSSNPSIWSVDLELDRVLVKSSLRKNYSSAGTPTEGRRRETKRSLPEHLSFLDSSYPQHPF